MIAEELRHMLQMGEDRFIRIDAIRAVYIDCNNDRNVCIDVGDMRGYATICANHEQAVAFMEHLVSKIENYLNEERK